MNVQFALNKNCALEVYDVFAVYHLGFFFLDNFSRVINLLLTKLARDRAGRISALGPYCQDLGPIFSQNGPRAWLIRYIYWSHCSH